MSSKEPNAGSTSPVVSVVIPAFNPSPVFLREAVQSVLAQTFESWELLLVDDGSGSSSTPLFSEVVSMAPERIRYLRHPHGENRGSSATRNLGLLEARGRYVAFLDDDDVWLPEKLEEQVEIMAGHPSVAMVYGRSLYWYSWTGRGVDLGRDALPAQGVPVDSVYHPPGLVADYVTGQATVPCPCSVLVRRSAALEVGGFEEAFRFSHDDQAFYAKICLAFPVYVSGACWDRYRQHPQQLWASNAGSNQDAQVRLRFLRWLTDYVRERRMDAPEVHEAASRARWMLAHYAKLDPGSSPSRWARLHRWFKKWVLRVEKHILPGFVRRRIWVPR